MFDIITIGAATRDVFVKSDIFDVHESDSVPHEMEACFPMGAKIDIEELVLETGGGATNAAATLARLGFSTATICAVGDDSSSRDVMDAFAQDEISTDFVQKIADKKTGYSIIIVAGSGERSILVHRGAARMTASDKVDWENVKAEWLYITSLGGSMELLERALNHAEENNIKVAWNPGNAELKLGLSVLEPLIQKADVFNLNKEEASMLANTDTSEMKIIFDKLRKLPKKLTVITDGPDGAYSAEPDGDILFTNTIDVPTVNTTGAGDAFGSGLVAGLMHKDDIRYALAVGIWNATGCIQIMGAKRGLLENFPNHEQVNQVTIQPWK